MKYLLEPIAAFSRHLPHSAYINCGIWGSGSLIYRAKSAEHIRQPALPKPVVVHCGTSHTVLAHLHLLWSGHIGGAAPSEISSRLSRRTFGLVTGPVSGAAPCALIVHLQTIKLEVLPTVVPAVNHSIPRIIWKSQPLLRAWGFSNPSRVGSGTYVST